MTKPLKICLIMQGDRGWLGGTEYIKNIIFALNSLPAETRSTFELYLMVSQLLDQSFYSQLQPYLNGVFYKETDLKLLPIQDYINWKALKFTLKSYLRKIKPQASMETIQVDAFLKKQKIDFVYPYFDGESTLQSYRSVPWIPDFQHKYLPNFFTHEEIQSRDKTMAWIASKAPVVVLSSKTAELDFCKFFPNAISKTEVLQFKSSPNPTWYEESPHHIQQKYSLPDRFFIVSNQFWQHKNHLLVFKALNLLQKRSIYPNLVCTGHIYDRRQPGYSDTILQSVHQLNLAKQVFLLGLIPKVDQVQLMRRSLAVIQPSLFEGWSTLVEDARCFGKHILLSDLPVNLEQNPPHSSFFKRNSPEELADLLATCWENLLVGPDSEKEIIARDNSFGEIQAFGLRFLKIARGN